MTCEHLWSQVYPGGSLHPKFLPTPLPRGPPRGMASVQEGAVSRQPQRRASTARRRTAWPRGRADATTHVSEGYSRGDLACDKSARFYMWGREFDDPWSVSSRAHRAITWVILQHTGSDEHRQVKRMSHMRPDVLFHVANQIAASITAAMAPGLYDGDRARQRAGCVAALRLLPGALGERSWQKVRGGGPASRGHPIDIVQRVQVEAALCVGFCEALFKLGNLATIRIAQKIPTGLGHHEHFREILSPAWRFREIRVRGVGEFDESNSDALGPFLGSPRRGARPSGA